MAILHTADLRRQAKERLGQIPFDPKRLVLIHTAVALGATLLMTVCNYLFSLKIADTGGLGGMGLRTALTTAQSLMELAVTVLLPFWEIGLAYGALQWAKGENVTVPDLLQGFRSFRSVFGLRILTGGILLGLAFFLVYPCAMLFSMTPWVSPIMELYAPLMESATTVEEMQALMTPEFAQQAMSHMLPFFILYGAVYIGVAIPLLYRLRFGDFALMEGLTCGKALAASLRITRKNCLQILKVDLHFWWFYLLQGLSLALCYGDAILTMTGINLPIQPDARFFLFYIAGIACQTVLFWRFGAQRITAYALAYGACQEPSPVATQ